MIKMSDMTEAIVPRYREFSVKSIWPLIKAVDELNINFPDYTDHQLPDRRFMFVILGTFRHNELISMIDNAREQRAITQNQPSEDYVYIEQNILNEIKSVFIQKGKN